MYLLYKKEKNDLDRLINTMASNIKNVHLDHRQNRGSQVSNLLSEVMLLKLYETKKEINYKLKVKYLILPTNKQKDPLEQ